VRTSDTPQGESVVAARNALALGSALAATGTIALLIRLLIPRFLGPGAFGELRLAESFAEMLFIVLTFGVDLQLRREAALDSSKVTGYLGGLTVLRVAIGAVAIGASVFVLPALGVSRPVLLIFVVVALAQVLLVLNNSYAALEHAAGDVKWLARTNFAVKLLWAGLLIAVLIGSPSGLAIAAVALAVEAFRFVWLTVRGVHRHQLRLRPEVGLATAAIVSSLPFFVNALAHNLYARIGIGWLAAGAGETEVGLYAAAANLAAIALLGVPLLSWVLVPSASRAAARSDREFSQLVSGTLRASLLGAVPVSVTLWLGADLLLGGLFGNEYRAAAPVLRILAPTVALTYVATVCAIALIQQGRTWTVALVSITGVGAMVALNATLIPWGLRALAPAGAAQGAAWSMLATETFVTITMAALSRTVWFDVRLARTIGAIAGGIAAVVIIAGSWPAGSMAMAAVAIAAFAVFVITLGGFDRKDLAFARGLIGRTRPASATPLAAAQQGFPALSQR